MANFKKSQGPKLPEPPPAEAAFNNLSAPETAPATEKMDGRSARATGRTKQLATRVREDFYDELRIYAATHRLKLVEVLERGLEALKRQEKAPQKTSS